MSLLLEILIAHGYEFSAEELLFLQKTFESISSVTLEIETDDGYSALDVMKLSTKSCVGSVPCVNLSFLEVFGPEKKNGQVN